MGSVIAVVGMLSVGLFLGLTTIGLRRLGAGEVANGLVVATVLGALVATVISSLG